MVVIKDKKVIKANKVTMVKKVIKGINVINVIEDISIKLTYTNGGALNNGVGVTIVVNKI
jgi:hypothetical protein